jgi:hypothetical protein
VQIDESFYQAVLCGTDHGQQFWAFTWCCRRIASTAFCHARIDGGRSLINFLRISNSSIRQNKISNVCYKNIEHVLFACQERTFILAERSDRPPQHNRKEWVRRCDSAEWRSHLQRFHD